MGPDSAQSFAAVAIATIATNWRNVTSHRSSWEAQYLANLPDGTNLTVWYRHGEGSELDVWIGEIRHGANLNLKVSLVGNRVQSRTFISTDKFGTRADPEQIGLDWSNSLIKNMADNGLLTGLPGNIRYQTQLALKDASF